MAPLHEIIWVCSAAIGFSIHLESAITSEAAAQGKKPGPPYIILTKGSERRIRKFWGTKSNDITGPLWCERGSQGLGERLRMAKQLFHIVEKFDVTYVCDPGHFCSGHGKYSAGDLFGCFNSSYAIGEAASYRSVMKQKKHLARVPFESKKESELYLREDFEVNRDRAIYTHEWPLHEQRGWGMGYKWLRRQYHLVRNLDPQRASPRCWKARSDSKTKIALTIRRGDRAPAPGKPCGQGSACVPVSKFVEVLDAFFEGKIPALSKFNRNVEDAHIVVI
jgi:hypothetical protein